MVSFTFFLSYFHVFLSFADEISWKDKFVMAVRKLFGKSQISHSLFSLCTISINKVVTWVVSENNLQYLSDYLVLIKFKLKVMGGQRSAMAVMILVARYILLFLMFILLSTPDKCSVKHPWDLGWSHVKWSFLESDNLDFRTKAGLLCCQDKSLPELHVNISIHSNQAH